MRNDSVETQAPPVPRRRLGPALILLAALAMAGVMTLAAGALRDPVHVDRVEVDNRSPWRLNVAVSDAQEDGWLLLGPVDRDELRDFRHVVDQGDRWAFRFSYGGHVVVTEVTRTELADSGWQVPVPDALETELEGSGVPETPR